MIEEMLKNYIDKSNDIISNLANISAILYAEVENINWLGFYLFDGEELYLGPFQGLPAVSKIKVEEGVCGKAAREGETIVVDDVHCFEGHIACDIRSKSEIVIPIIQKDGTLYGLLDVDSPIKDRFTDKEKELFEKIVLLIKELLESKN